MNPNWTQNACIIQETWFPYAPMVTEVSSGTMGIVDKAIAADRITSTMLIEKSRRLLILESRLHPPFVTI